MAIHKSLLILLISILCPSLLLGASQQHPMLMEGKKALYQRVLCKPGALLYKEIQQPEGDPATPFSAFYVYERRIKNGAGWLKLGQNRHGEITGWMPEADTIPWNQGLTVAFRDPMGNDRVLLFNEKENLKALINDNDRAQYQKLYSAAESGKLDTGSPVIAIQPSTHIDILKDFYLVPIRDHEDIYIGGEQARMLQVSSVPLMPAMDTTPRADDMNGEKQSSTDIKPFRSAVVFVIDSTLSMDPYIDRTREAVRKIYDTITKEDLTGDVSFGLIAFRDNPQVAPGLDYLTKTFVNLEQGRDADGFFNQVSSLKAATVSSRDFNEDSFAGVNEAISGIDWQGQDARYVVLITDAGPREAGDPLSGTGMSSAALRQLALDKGIALSVLHLLTPSIMANHVKAEETYRDLSYYPGIGSFYFGVETGNVARFGRVLDALATQITEQVKLAAMAAAGKSMAMERQSRKRQTAQANDQLAQFQEKVAKLGYALRMRYLQQKDKQQIPSVFNAWLVDRDINDPRRQTLDVRVLLTRDQLSDMHSIMQQVLITAEEGLLSPRTFLNDLKSLAATIARDPEQLGMTTRVTGAREGNLADMGFMREYIEDLPYTGEVMNLSLENWQDWPARDQISFINRLEEKINYYQVLHDHTDLWVSLDGGPISGDSVFPIALEMLP